MGRGGRASSGLVRKTNLERESELGGRKGSLAGNFSGDFR